MSKLSPEEFCRTYRAQAQEVATELVISEIIPLSQWAYETGWGDATAGNNLAGIEDGHGGFAVYATPADFNAAYVRYMQKLCPNLHSGAGDPVNVFAGTTWNPNPGYGAAVQAVFTQDIAPALQAIDAVPEVTPPAPEPTPMPAPEPSPTPSPDPSPVPSPTSEPSVTVFDFAAPGQLVGVYAADGAALQGQGMYKFAAGCRIGNTGKETSTAAMWDEPDLEFDSGTTGGLGLIIPASDAARNGLTATGSEGIIGATGSETMGDATVSLALTDRSGQTVILQNVPATIDPQAVIALLGTGPLNARGIGFMCRPKAATITLFTDEV